MAARPVGARAASSAARARTDVEEANARLQALNEELQAANEELETSREELATANEELATANAELQAKVLDGTRADDDLRNMLADTGFAALVVDLRLRILRFTPSLDRLIHLIPADVGRPLGDLVAKLVGDGRLASDVQAVVDTLRPIERAVQATDGGWFVLRIRPYRTLESVVEGAVISFFDLTKLALARDARPESRPRPGDRPPHPTDLNENGGRRGR